MTNHASAPSRPFERMVLRSSLPTSEVTTRPRRSRPTRTSNCVYLSKGHDQVRITGVAEIVSDRDLLDEIWEANPLLRNYLGSIDNPDLIVYRVVPDRVRFMREWALEYHEVEIGTPDA